MNGRPWSFATFATSSQSRQSFAGSILTFIPALGDWVNAELLGKRPDALSLRLALEGKGQLGTLCRHRLGNAPGNRVIIGNTHDQPALALHQILHATRPSPLISLTSSPANRSGLRPAG